MLRNRDEPTPTSFPNTERKTISMKLRLKTISLAVSTLLLHATSHAQGYHSNDLTPPTSGSGRLNAASGGRQVGAAPINNATGYFHAVLLNGNALAVTDLHPPGYYYSMAMCSDDVQQGGWGYSLAGGVHALVWNGTAASFTDLTPSGYSFSYCLGVHNGEQVGYAQNQSYFVTASHAFSWLGTASSGVDLHPAFGYAFSRATGCRDGEEVGYVSSIAYPDGDSSGYRSTSRAVKWNGSAASAVDLHPVGYVASEAVCTSGTQQGGWGLTFSGVSQSQHAMLWSGSPETAVDLHPVGYTDSKVTAMFGSRQVGEGWIGTQGIYGSVRHALAWNGSADTVVDLNQYLPAGYANAVATGIDSNGDIVGYAYNGAHPYGLAVPVGAIAVVFAPGAAPASGLAAITLSPASVAPGDPVQVTVTLGSAAPTGGANITFLSTLTTLLGTPAPVVIPEGESSVSFPLIAGGSTLAAPASLKLYATDGSASAAALLTIKPIVKLSAMTANAVEGGFTTYATITLSIPAQVGGALVSLTSANPALVAVPPTITVPQGYASLGFSLLTTPVTVATTVPVTASLDGSSVSAVVTLSPAPVVSISGVSGPEVVGGQVVPITVTLNNFPRDAAGATVSLTSGDTGTLQVPATVVVPQGQFSATVNATTTAVNGRKGVSIKATYNGSALTATVFVNPIPTVTITQADYMLDTKMFKVQATSTFANDVLTYGTSPDAPPIGTMQFEQGVFKGSILMDTAPSKATVWSSFGGFATIPVSIKTGVGGNSTGGGGGGGGSTSTTYKLTIATSGKGSVSVSPSAANYTAGTVVTLTATPAAGSPWAGWSGDATGTTNPIKVTITRDMKVTANFK